MISARVVAFGLLTVGSIVTAKRCPVADVSIIAHEGPSVGVEEVHNGVNMYISKPDLVEYSYGDNTTYDKAVLYLTDVFGIQLAENRLLADSFARAGYLTVAPDLFNGTPAPADLNAPGFNATAFLARHDVNVTDPLVAKAVAYLRDTVGVASVAVTGYCFGGRYAYRFVAAGKGADVAFAAHPSLLADDEILAIRGPTSLAAGENDELMPPERRNEIVALMGEAGQPYSAALYSGCPHGFGVRANISDPEQKFGKEEAFFQAVRFFDSWL